MAQWKFQLLPNRPGVIGLGYRMDAVGEAVETEVNDALPYRFRFHKIGKIVLALGPGGVITKEYIELLGVAQKLVPAFDLSEYASASDAEKVSMLRAVIVTELRWFETNFDDAQFVAKARAKLPWAS
jgi:hypothetical protein